MRIALAMLVAGASLYPALNVWRNAARSALPALGTHIERKLTFRVIGDRLRAEQQLDIHGDESLCNAHRSAPRMGEVFVDDSPLQFALPEVTVTGGGGSCTVTTAGEAQLFLKGDTSVLVFFSPLPAHDFEVTFDVQDVRVAGLSKAPSRHTPAGPFFHWGDPPARVSFRLTRIAPAPRIGDVVTRIDQNWLPYLGPLLTTILIALPYALFVITGRRHAAPGRRPLVEIAGWLLTLYLLLHLTTLLIAVAGWPGLQPFVSGSTHGAIFTAFACVVWPLLITQWWRKGRPSPSIAEPDTRVPREGLIAVVAFLIACGAPLFLRDEAVSAIGIVALAAGCYWLIRELGGGVVHAALLLLAASALYILRGLYASAVTLTLGTLFLLCLITVARAGFAHGQRLTIGQAVAFLLAAAVGVQRFLPRAFSTPYGEISVLADAANNAMLLALAVAFLLLLRDHSATGASSSMAIDLGFAFALAIFYNHRYGLYGAVVVGSGYALLRYWLFAAEGRRSELLQLDAGKIRDGILRLIALHDAERAVDQRRKAMLAKVESGDAKWAEYETSTGELEAVVSAYRQDAATMETSRNALAHGPVEPPWKRGTNAAWLAAMLAIPWCITYAAVFSRDRAPASPQWWLDVIATFILGLTQWPLFAFFFGYFYPDIRGRNGLVKALVYFVTVAVPPVLAYVIFWAELPSTIFALWIFQNFIQAMVLGLFAGDYRTLRACGLGWRHLRDVHNLGVLTAYGTSVVVAIGGAIASAVAADVVDALAKMVK